MTDREAACAWAQRVAADPRAVVLDTETTALDETAEVVDIAIIDLSGRILLDSLCCPLRPIPAASSAVHGITEKHVHKSPFWKELYPKVAAVLNGRTVVGWNSGYDFGVVNGVCRADKLPEFPGPWEDAMQHFGAFAGERSRRGPGYRWFRLTDAAARMGITVPSAHRALQDCLTTVALIRSMASHDKPAETAEQTELFPMETGRREAARVPSG